MNAFVSLYVVVLTIFLEKTMSFIVEPITFQRNNHINNNTEVGHRTGRFFPFFTIIRFENTACNGIGGSIGTCFTRRECNDLKGIAMGSCASRRGVCCVVQRTCGGSTNSNNTYFSNTEYPSTTTSLRGCTMRITRCNSNVCQLRVDMNEFSLAQPGPSGCMNDSMTISGGATQVSSICGESRGQHFYVDFQENDPIVLSITGNGANSFARRWNMQLTQIPCDAPCGIAAPSGCLMSYSGVSGTVQSFNYGESLVVPPGTTGLGVSREISDLNYGVCIRMLPGYCSITWTQSAGMYSFTVSGDATSTDLVGNPAVSDTGTACNTDYIIIPGAGVNDRFCGLAFPQVTTSSKPFVLYVVTNGNETGDTANRGFSLDYIQNLC